MEGLIFLVLAIFFWAMAGVAEEFAKYEVSKRFFLCSEVMAYIGCIAMFVKYFLGGF